MKKKLILSAIILVIVMSGVAIADHLRDKHAAWEILNSTNSTVLQYLEEQEMGGEHITITFSTFSTVHMQRDGARSDLGL